MAFTSVPTVATGDLWSAAQHNTYIKDNFAAVWVGSAAGDIDYYTAATTKTRLAAVNGGILKSSGSAPSWLAMGNSFRVLTANTTTNVPQWSSLVSYRQGGSATNWQTSGTTNQTLTDGIIQLGVLDVTTNAGGVGSAAITYTLAFSGRPFVSVNIGGDSGGTVNVSFSDDSITGCTLRVFKLDGGVGTFQVNWMAIGNWT